MISVDACSCGSDRSEFVSIERAWERALESVTAVDGEEIASLRHARGRVTYRAVKSGVSLPPFDQSAMDGYAVRTRDAACGLESIPVVGRRVAGATVDTISANECGAVRIFTGAAIPEGFDAVAMQEDCTRVGDSVVIHKWPRQGENVRPAGDDVPAGSVIIEARTRIDARHTLILAATGTSSVPVRRLVRVGVLSTGNELREPTEKLRRGEIHDSNRAMLLSLIEDNSSAEVVDLGCIQDNPALIAETLRAAARDFDVLISTGGVSVGDEDHIRSAVLAAGGTFEWLRAAIKPGKPASIGRIGSANFIGLPGNPVSALVTFFWFGRPVVLRRMGLHPATPMPFSARAAFEEVRHTNRDEFVPVVIVGSDDDGRPLVERRRRVGSARISSLLEADGLIRISSIKARVNPGDAIDFYPFATAFSL